MKQLNLLNETREEETIRFIQEHEPPEGYFLGFSGGKDSVVMYDLAKKSGAKFQAYYADTGIDPPELVKFIKENYPDVIFLKPHLTRKRKFPNWKGTRSFFGMIQACGYPTRINRWCCNVLKKDPSKNIPLKHRLMGIRAEESAARANRPRIDYFKNYKQWLYKPIFFWLEWEIWEYIENNNLLYCSLYDEGFDRLGCVVCPFHSYKLHQKHKEHWPKYFVAFEKAMKKLFDNYLYVKDPRSGAINYSIRVHTFEDFLE